MTFPASSSGRPFRAPTIFCPSSHKALRRRADSRKSRCADEALRARPGSDFPELSHHASTRTIPPSATESSDLPPSCAIAGWTPRLRNLWSFASPTMTPRSCDGKNPPGAGKGQYCQETFPVSLDSRLACRTDVRCFRTANQDGSEEPSRLASAAKSQVVCLNQNPSITH